MEIHTQAIVAKSMYGQGDVGTERRVAVKKAT